MWADLAALGEKVREPAVLEDARAVARETMRRARKNVEILIPRLREIGYRFQAEPLEPPPRDSVEQVRELEKILKGALPLSLEAWWLEVGRVTFLGKHPVLNPKGGGSDVLPDPLDFSPLEYALSSAEEWAVEGGSTPAAPAPPSREWEAGVKMWRDRLTQSGIAAAEIEAMLAPSIAQFERQDRERERQIAEAAAKPRDTRFPFDFAPDELHKANISGATYDVMLPDAGGRFPFGGSTNRRRERRSVVRRVSAAFLRVGRFSRLVGAKRRAAAGDRTSDQGFAAPLAWRILGSGGWGSEAGDRRLAR